ncbi:uncharacterized protein SCHCODRAFT_02743365 [Schizophyllum commune H4-8]|nr:uncharacterized protein SCHCODRAFT_02743365 [Schizophyllum commune H4-8]KAI5900419.1 hypothetical protein SCHCODRAFT_02743365 [Schizophyllum commune H4-8]
MFLFGVCDTQIEDDKGVASTMRRNFTFACQRPVNDLSAFQQEPMLAQSVLTMTPQPPKHSAYVAVQASSIDTLPAEILADVFALCIADLPTDHNFLDTSLCPWTLGQVCHRWRVIVARHSSHLWRILRVRLRCARFDSPFVAWQHQLFRKALSHSHDHPLDLDLDATTCHAQVYANALQALQAQAPRWRNITIVLPRWCGSWHVVHGNFPQLEFFGIEGSRDVLTHGDGCINLCNAPKLRGLRIGRLPSDLSICVPWQQLKVLHDADAYASYGTLLQQLSHCRNLEEFKFYTEYSILDQPGDELPTEKITLCHLRSLEIVTAPADEYPCGLLHSLTTPSLKELSTTISDQEQLLEFTIFSSALLWRSSAPLTKLVLNAEGYVEINDAFGLLFKFAPHLTTLDITGDFVRCFFDLLLEREEGDDRKFKYIPHLTDLKLHATDASDVRGMRQVLKTRFLQSGEGAHEPACCRRMEVWMVAVTTDCAISNDREYLVLSCEVGGTC